MQLAVAAKLSSKDDIYRINNVKFYLPNMPYDFVSKEIVSNSDYYEIDELRKVDKYLQENGVFLDVGANVGNHTLYWSLDSSKKAKHIYAFEVMPTTASILKKNVEINNLQGNVTIFNFGLSDEDTGAKVAYFNSSNVGATTIQKTKDGNEGITLRKYDNLGIKDKIDFVKIDVEGHEFQVLNGMIGMLKKDKPMLWIELWKDGIIEDGKVVYSKESLRHNNLNKERINNLLSSLGYKMIKQINGTNFLYKAF